MNVKVVRVYLSEDSPYLNTIYDYLHEQKVKGATVFRGVKGFGHTGKLREARLMNMHFNLPLVIEFIDEPTVADKILKYLADKIEPLHTVHWLASLS